MMVNVIRVASTDSATAAADLAAVYHRDAAPVDVLETALDNDDFILLLGYLEDDCAGYLHASLLDRLDGERMLLIYDIGVEARFRRRGVGTALLIEALTIADDLGIGRSWLVTESTNAAATAFYASLGGEQFPAVGYEWARR